MIDQHSDPVTAAVSAIREAGRVSVFTGAGISVESGIPPFRGPDGLYARHDPRLFEIGYFTGHTRECWELLHRIFYRDLATSRPNRAHICLALLEKQGIVASVITQNIDNLHVRAGSRRVIHFHGSIGRLVCLGCAGYRKASALDWKVMPPVCGDCGGILKPDIVFFGEPIPPLALKNAAKEARKSDLMIVIGSTGEVLPAATIPAMAKENGARIIEINTRESNFTPSITDIFLLGPAAGTMDAIYEKLQ